MALRAALLILVAALLAPAAASATYRDFRRPSGKVGCAFYDDSRVEPSVRCDWRGAGDRGVTVGTHGRARVIKATDTVLNPDAPVLAYGRRTRFRALRCTSRRTGMTCRSTRSGHGFTVSVEKRRLF